MKKSWIFILILVCIILIVSGFYLLRQKEETTKTIKPVEVTESTELTQKPTKTPEMPETDVISFIDGSNDVTEENHHRLQTFITNCNKQKSDSIRITRKTIEGDPIYTDILYHAEENYFEIINDTTADQFDTQDVISNRYENYQLEVIENDGEYTVQLVPNGEFENEPLTILIYEYQG